MSLKNCIEHCQEYDGSKTSFVENAFGLATDTDLIELQEACRAASDSHDLAATAKEHQEIARLVLRIMEGCAARHYAEQWMPPSPQELLDMQQDAQDDENDWHKMKYNNMVGR